MSLGISPSFLIDEPDMDMLVMKQHALFRALDLRGELINTIISSLSRSIISELAQALKKK